MMMMTKPGYFELDFCIARRILHAQEAQYLKMKVNAPVEKMRMAKSPLLSLEVNCPFAEDWC